MHIMTVKLEAIMMQFPLQTKARLGWHFNFPKVLFHHSLNVVRLLTSLSHSPPPSPSQVPFHQESVLHNTCTRFSGGEGKSPVTHTPFWIWVTPLEAKPLFTPEQQYTVAMEKQIRDVIM